jgi:hypothetical protein
MSALRHVRELSRRDLLDLRRNVVNSCIMDVATADKSMGLDDEAIIE